MNKEIIFIADFFVDQVAGGGELNNEEVIKEFILLRKNVLKVKSHVVTEEFIEKNRSNKFIVGNFVNMTEGARKALYDKEYLIYEHDHKYLSSRNPADFDNFQAPKEEIINYDFYKNAKAVLCQTTFHANIIKLNLELENIVSLGGNLWPLYILELLEELHDHPKENRCAIMVSDNWHKNTEEAIAFCNAKGMDFRLIPPAPYKEFLRNLGKNNKFVFLPKTPETLSRVVVEARMMGMGIITNNNVGAVKEDWFELKGPPLVALMKQKRNEIPHRILNILGEA